MFLVTAGQMMAAEKAANESGLSYDVMMEQAGAAVAEAADRFFGVTGKRITILVGPGNNGGDGLVAARHLIQRGGFVQLYLWKRQNLADDLNWERLRGYQVKTIHRRADRNSQQLKLWLENCDILVDALLGTGVSRPIKGDLAELLTAAHQILKQRHTQARASLIDPIDPAPPPEPGPLIVAVDVPSGLRSNTGQLDPLALPAELTVTFAAPKRGHVSWPGAAHVGELLVADIGIAPEHFEAGLPQLATPDFLLKLLPERSPLGHKGTFGKVLVLAGSQCFCGAPALAGAAVGRAGAGLVTLALPQNIQPLVAPALTEATYLPLPAQDGSLSEAGLALLQAQLADYDALLVGPGLGQASSTQALLQALLLGDQVSNLPPLIVDADGLNLLARQEAWWTKLPPNSILTPHPGEMSRLTGQSIADFEHNRLENVVTYARKWGQVILYKGAFSVIANPQGKVMVLPFANPALATAGSGDVLAGAIAALRGQGLEPFTAAIAGGYLHGLAGELARRRLGEAGVVAGDLLPLLPLAWREILGKEAGGMG